MSRTSASDTVVTLKGYKHGSTEKAILFETHIVGEDPVADPKREWFPLSQMKRSVMQAKGSQEMDTIVVSEWIARTKGLV